MESHSVSYKVTWQAFRTPLNKRQTYLLPSAAAGTRLQLFPSAALDSWGNSNSLGSIVSMVPETSGGTQVSAENIFVPARMVTM